YKCSPLSTCRRIQAGRANNSRCGRAVSVDDVLYLWQPAKARLAMKTMRCGFVSARDTRLIEHRLNLRPYGQLLNDSHLDLAYGDIWTELLLLRGKDDTGRFAVLGSRSKPHDLPRRHRDDVTRRQR